MKAIVFVTISSLLLCLTDFAAAEQRKDGKQKAPPEVKGKTGAVTVAIKTALDYSRKMSDNGMKVSLTITARSQTNTPTVCQFQILHLNQAGERRNDQFVRYTTVGSVQIFQMNLEPKESKERKIETNRRWGNTLGWIARVDIEGEKSLILVSSDDLRSFVNFPETIKDIHGYTRAVADSERMAAEGPGK